MSRKTKTTKKTKENKTGKVELSPEPKLVENPIEKLQNVMAFGLQSAYELAVNEGAAVVRKSTPEVKAGNVDALPEIKK